MASASHARVQVHKLPVRSLVALAFAASGLATGQPFASASPRSAEVVHGRAAHLASVRRTPALDLPASQAMVGACNSSARDPRACDTATLKAIDSARASEGLSPLDLPAGYEALGMPAQLVAVTNAERTSRGLPAWHSPDGNLDLLAAQALGPAKDPNGPAGRTWAANTASGTLTVLQADYEWMYDDGPGGTNPGCSATNQARCWWHRDNILSPWPGNIGTAVEPRANGRLVLAELMVANS
ncbi:MAG TPA: hypothetical protein VMS00_05285 [Acidimicrobiales bacterium]|nr:hypothetical protein [Acidimicrobiales bacterium]